jgi:hypothetical protein
MEFLEKAKKTHGSMGRTNSRKLLSDAIRTGSATQRFVSSFRSSSQQHYQKLENGRGLEERGGGAIDNEKERRGKGKRPWKDNSSMHMNESKPDKGTRNQCLK